MPIYEYGCQKCGAVTDIRHGFKEKNTEPCPACGGVLMRRFNPAGIVFKGSGFYATDSRKAAGSSDGAPASSDAKSAPASGEKKSEGSTSSDGGTSSESGASSGSASSDGKQGDGGTKPAAKKSETAA